MLKKIKKYKLYIDSNSTDQTLQDLGCYKNDYLSFRPLKALFKANAELAKKGNFLLKDCVIIHTVANHQFVSISA